VRVILSILGASLPEGAREVGIESPEVFPHGAASFVEMSRLMESLSQGDRLRFLYPATAEGSQYASALSSYFTKRGYPSAVIEVPGFVYFQNPPTERGLRALVSLVCGEFRAARRQGQQPVLYEPGECGSVTAYAALIGQIFRIPVYSYCQPSSVVPLYLPGGLPPLLYRYESFFRWLQEERRPTAQVHRRLIRLPHSLNDLIGSDDNGFTTLSPLGELYFEAYLSQCEMVK